ncbi:hypothetical protein FOVG_19984 [Fusarium oxysporum f. sp. pisi HDV247]|uniref:Uncharacterized protein n=1 Tax=Fusarium oxysporum f. sp. pisi HDV247 TaxID=1080344 RepID=W9NKL5_FUSOX|nr:hypothetical protein FOVG_19984 [Fusarium oxysporum f. sp. pisi HDV247]
MARGRLVEDDVKRRVTGPVDQLQTLMGVVVHDDGHPWHEHEDAWYWYRAVFALVQHHGGFFLARQTVPPLMLGDEDSHHRPLLDLERQGRLHVQVPPIPVQRRHHGDARFPRYPPPFPVAPRVEQVQIRAVLHAQPDPLQQSLQFRIPGGAHLLVQHNDRRELLPQRVGLVVLVPLLGLERVAYVPRDGCAGEQDRPLLDRAELVEVSAEEDDGDSSKISLRSAKPAELLVRRV